MAIHSLLTLPLQRHENLTGKKCFTLYTEVAQFSCSKKNHTEISFFYSKQNAFKAIWLRAENNPNLLVYFQAH